VGCYDWFLVAGVLYTALGSDLGLNWFAGLITGKRLMPDATNVFERFYRGSGSLEREGFGLGLAIAKRMIDVMGGEITVDSQEGQGSTFTIRLRQAAPSPTPVA